MENYKKAVFSGVFPRVIKIWCWSVSILAAIFQPYERIMFMVFADSNNILLANTQNITGRICSDKYHAQTLLSIKQISFRRNVETAPPIGNTLSEQIPASEYLLLPGREGLDGTGRVNLCHEDETRKTGGPHPECFLP